jgi:hypothetical protein
MDDAFSGGESLVALGQEVGWIAFRPGQNEPLAEFPITESFLRNHLGRAGDLAHGGDGWNYDTQSWQRLPPQRRRFQPDLPGSAPDGRFVLAPINYEINPQPVKELPADREWEYHPGWGMIAAKSSALPGTIRLLPIRLLPQDSRLELPADLLELWAQVAVRGAIGPGGTFVKWDEPTWERKRQQLAAVAAPRPDLPFPGYVATDKLHWLRAEFGEAKTDADKVRIAPELLRRAEALGDRAETVRWRAELTKFREAAPPPRPVMP